MSKCKEHLESIEIDAIEDDCDGPVLSISHFGKDEKCFFRHTYCGGSFTFDFKFCPECGNKINRGD